MFQWLRPKRVREIAAEKHKAIELKKKIALDIIEKKTDESITSIEDRRFHERRKVGESYA